MTSKSIILLAALGLTVALVAAPISWIAAEDTPSAKSPLPSKNRCRRLRSPADPLKPKRPQQ